MTSTERAAASRRRKAEEKLREDLPLLLARLRQDDLEILVEIAGVLRKADPVRRDALADVLFLAASDEPREREIARAEIGRACFAVSESP